MASSEPSLFGVRRRELPLVGSMFGYFFLVITTFWILKPIKKSLFIGFYRQGFSLAGHMLRASQAELLAKVLNMVVAFAAVVVFSWLVRRFRREQLTYIFSGFFLVSFGLYALVLGSPSPPVVWSFYLFGDLYSSLMVATFFSFLSDSVTADTAKRIYGLIGVGGVLGGVFGSMFVRVWINAVPEQGWMGICGLIALLIMGLATVAARNLAVEADDGPEEQDSSEQEKGSESNPAFEGAKLVVASRYLLAIVGMIAIYEIISTVLDFQFTATLEHYFPDKQAYRTQQATQYLITNVSSFCVQLFLTSYVMRRFGVRIALFFLPVSVLLFSSGFLVMPVMWAGSLLNSADNAFSYSINQSARETLYVPTTADEKYKAKAFIDMFVQRFAKVIAVVISLAITTYFASFSSVRWLSLLSLGLGVVWLWLIQYAGKQFEARTASAGELSSGEETAA